MSKRSKTRLNRFADSIQKEKVVYVWWVGSFVHAQGPYKHLRPGNPDFEKKVQVQCFPTLLQQAVSSQSSVSRRWNECSAFGGEGNEEMGSPSLSPSTSSFPRLASRSSLPGERTLGASLSFIPQYWQTGQTSLVGPWCQWVGTAAEMKRKGGTVISWPKQFFFAMKVYLSERSFSYSKNTCASFLQKCGSRRVLEPLSGKPHFCSFCWMSPAWIVCKAVR